MIYVTGIYCPPARKRHWVGLTRKHYFNAVDASQKEINTDLIEHNIDLLKDKLYICVDVNFETVNPKFFEKIQSLSNNVILIDNLTLNRGLFYQKAEIVKKMMLDFSQDVLWFDFNDTYITESLSDDEVKMLSKKDLALEFEWRRPYFRGLHNFDGSLIDGLNFLKAPQNGIYYMNSLEFIDDVLKENIYCDELAFAYVLEKRYNLFQDSPDEERIKFSANGLFYSFGVKKYQLTTYLHKDHFSFKPKIFHKFNKEKMKKLLGESYE